VDKTCRQFCGNLGDKIIDTENGIVYEANVCGLWKPLPGSLKGPTGSPGSAFITVNSEIQGGLAKTSGSSSSSSSSSSVMGAHGLSGQTTAELPDATNLQENTLFYEISTGRLFIIAGISYGYVVKTWVLLSDLESDLGINLLKNSDNTFCDMEKNMIWCNNQPITANLLAGDHVLDVHTGNQYLVKKGGSNGYLQYIGCLKGGIGPIGPEGPIGKGLYDQVLLQPVFLSGSDKKLQGSSNLLMGSSMKITVSKTMPVFFGNSEKLFNVSTNRIELPNYLKGPVLIKMNLFLMVGHGSGLTLNDKICVAIKKFSSLADWCNQMFTPNLASTETFIAMTEIFTGNPGDIFEIQLRNLTSQPMTIKVPQLASGNRLFLEFNVSSS
jgi:hypothetical protein